MASGRVVSVNTGRASDAEWAGRLKRTAINKRPAAGPVRVGRLGVAGDEQVDKEDHGGYEQALYVYAREDLDWWVEQLGRELPDGTFGENITTAGIDNHYHGDRYTHKQRIIDHQPSQLAETAKTPR